MDAASSGDGSSGGPASDASAPAPPPPGSFAQRPLTKSIVTLTSEAEMSAFCAQYDAVIGRLTISSTTLKTLDALACLVEVTGAFEVDARLLTSAVLPNLRAVGGLDLGGAWDLATIGLPQLEFVRTLDLRIYDSEELASLALPRLVHIAGNLLLNSNTKLTDLSAPELTHVGVAITCTDPKLVHAGFANLVEVGDDFLITSKVLERIELQKLRKVGKQLWIPAGASYANVDLSQLETVGGPMTLDGNGSDDDLVTLDLSSLVSAMDVLIRNHPQLEEVRAPKLESAGTVYVSSPRLSSVDFSVLASADWLDFSSGANAEIVLPKLTGVRRTIETYGLRSFAAPLLTSLSSGKFEGGAADGFRLDLPLVTDVGVSLQLGTGLSELSMPRLQRIRSLSVLDTKLAQLEFADLEQAIDIQAARNPNLESVRIPRVPQLGDLWLSGPALRSVAFDSLTSLDELTFSDSPLLKTVTFPSLNEVGYAFTVRSTGLDELSLPQVTSAVRLYIVTNSQLAKLELPNARVNSLSIGDNPLLATIDLHSMDASGSFMLSNNGALTTLSGFTGLTTIFGDLVIVNHATLADLQGLHNIERVTGRFHITGNTALPKSETDALITAIGRENIQGELTVQ